MRHLFTVEVNLVLLLELPDGPENAESSKHLIYVALITAQLHAVASDGGNSAHCRISKVHKDHLLA